MSSTVIGWIVIVVNLALVVLNTYHMIRLRRARRQCETLRDQMTAAAAEFARRLSSGDVRATTDDGVSGTVVLISEGEHGVRITVKPDQKPQRLH